MTSTSGFWTRGKKIAAVIGALIATAAAAITIVNALSSSPAVGFQAKIVDKTTAAPLCGISRTSQRK